MASELIVTCYPSADTADRVVEAARRLGAAQLMIVDAAVLVRIDDAGKVTTRHVSPTRSPQLGRGVVMGTLVGNAFGLPLVGGGLGALGAAIAKRLGDAPIDEDFVRQITERLGPNTSALFSLIRRTGGPDRMLAAPEKVLPELAEFGGTLLHTTLPTEMDERIQTALDEAHRHFMDLQAAASPRKPRVVPIARSSASRSRSVVLPDRGRSARA
jgi:uncharacterized membrane protein